MQLGGGGGVPWGWGPGSGGVAGAPSQVHHTRVSLLSPVKGGCVRTGCGRVRGVGGSGRSTAEAEGLVL